MAHANGSRRLPRNTFKSRKEYLHQYHRREDVKARKRLYMRDYCSRPEIKEQRKLYESIRRPNSGKRQKRDAIGRIRQKKAYKLKKIYGISIEQRDQIFASNNGLCAICSSRPSEVIDHCHITNVVRGALCNKCNLAIGLLGDDPERMAKAIYYLNGKNPLQADWR